MPNGWTSGVLGRGYYLPRLDDGEDEFARNLALRMSQQPPDPTQGEFTQPVDESRGPIDTQGEFSADIGPEGYGPVTFPQRPETVGMPAEKGQPPGGPGRSGEAMPATPDVELHGQNLWDQIAKDMDRVQEHAHPGYASSQRGGYQATPTSFNVPPTIRGSDGKPYLAGNDGQPVMMNGRPVSFDQYYQSVRSAPAGAEDYDRQMQRHLNNEAASWNSGLYRWGEPEATGQFAGMIQQRQQYLQGLLQSVQNDPNLSPRARANAVSHLYAQAGQLASHWEKAQATTRQKTQEAGLHPDYGTPQGPELSPQMREQLQDAETALQQVRNDSSLSTAQKTQAVQVLGGRIRSLDPAGRYRSGQQPMTAIQKAMAQQVYTDPTTGHIYTVDPKTGAVKVTTAKAEKAEKAGKEIDHHKEYTDWHKALTRKGPDGETIFPTHDEIMERMNAVNQLRGGGPGSDAAAPETMDHDTAQATVNRYLSGQESDVDLARQAYQAMHPDARWQVSDAAREPDEQMDSHERTRQAARENGRAYAMPDRADVALRAARAQQLLAPKPAGVGGQPPPGAGAAGGMKREKLDWQKQQDQAKAEAKAKADAAKLAQQQHTELEKEFNEAVKHLTKKTHNKETGETNEAPPDPKDVYDWIRKKRAEKGRFLDQMQPPSQEQIDAGQKRLRDWWGGEGQPASPMRPMIEGLYQKAGQSSDWVYVKELDKLTSAHPGGIFQMPAEDRGKFIWYLKQLRKYDSSIPDYDYAHYGTAEPVTNPRTHKMDVYPPGPLNGPVHRFDQSGEGR